MKFELQYYSYTDNSWKTMSIYLNYKTAKLAYTKCKKDKMNVRIVKIR